MNYSGAIITQAYKEVANQLVAGELRMSKKAEDIGEIMLKTIDKLAGKESNLKLSFQDLTLDVGPAKVKLNGSIVLDVVYVEDTKQFFPERAKKCRFQRG